LRKMDTWESRMMYQEHILDLYKHPHNTGRLKGATHSHRGHNPLCGDDISIELIVDGEKRVKDVKFHGNGCALCIASASLITDAVKGKHIDTVLRLKKDDVLGMMKIPVSHVRLKCVLLPLEAVQKTIINSRGISSTE